MSLQVIPRNFIVYRKPYTNYFSLNKVDGWNAFKIKKVLKVIVHKSDRKNPRFFIKSPSDFVRRYTGTVHKSHYRNIVKLFLEFTSGTTRLLKPNIYLAGGMAVKLFMGKRASKITSDTDDFDFHFIAKNEKSIDKQGVNMVNTMYQHLNSFSKFVNKKYGLKTRIFIKELKGVPKDKPEDGYIYRKVYKVYRFYVLTPTKKIEFTDVSLVNDNKTKFIKMYGMNIPVFGDLWRDVAYTLSSTFIDKKSYIRNPLIGLKYKKGIKDIARLKNLLGNRNPMISKFIRTIVVNKNLMNSKRQAILIRRQMNQNQIRRVPSSRR
jgi:hypothetical protein